MLRAGPSITGYGTGSIRAIGPSTVHVVREYLPMLVKFGQRVPFKCDAIRRLSVLFSYAQQSIFVRFRRIRNRFGLYWSRDGPRPQQSYSSEEL